MGCLSAALLPSSKSFVTFVPGALLALPGSSFQKGAARVSRKTRTSLRLGRVHRLLSGCRRLKWVVYAKRPFGSSAQVLGYLGRYTHRVAISNHRLLGLEDGKVTFTWKDYRNGNAQQVMHLDAQEFIRRFLLHILPSGLVRIRYYGFLSNSHRREKLAICRDLIGTAKPQEPLSPQTPALQLLSAPQDWKTKYEQLTGHSLSLCPACRTGRMLTVELLQPTTSPRLPESQPEVVNSS
jgi:hypothetical protein